MISSGKATLRELGTVYGIRDVYMMLEVVMIDAHNRRKLSPRDAED